MFAAGVGGGLTGSIAGLASLVSYPALLAVGLPPVTANVTNTVSLTCSSLGSVLGSRPELRGQGDRVRRLGAAGLAGGIVGGVLLLSTPSGLFQRVVPWLIGFGSLTILARRRPATPGAGTYTTDSRLVVLLVFAIGVYGGYFGAAAGVLLLALFLAATPESLARSNALKNVVLGLANLIAGGLFVVFGSVRWSAAAPLALGLFIGASLGPTIVRRLPEKPLRIAIALAGIGLAIHLALDAYF